VLTATGDPSESLVDVKFEPWDIQNHLFKCAFDIGFALAGLIALSPVIVTVALTVKLEDGGPVLYRQERTVVFGETFDVFKFRSMTPKGESTTPVDDDENGRITSVGRDLRQTHSMRFHGSGRFFVAI